MSDPNALPPEVNALFEDTPTTPLDLKPLDEVLPVEGQDTPNDPWQTLFKGMNMEAGQLKQNYYNQYLMTRTDLPEAEEIDLLQKSTKGNYGNLSDGELQAAPWWVRAGVDATGLGLSLGHTAAVGAATGYATAAASAPLAAGLARIPGVGGYLGGAVEGGTFAGGFTVGSLTAMGTQSAGQMYGDLRLKGVSRDTASKVAGAFGLFSAGLGSVGLGAAQKLGGAAMSVGLRNSLVPLAQQAGFNTASAAARKVQTTLLTRLGMAYAQNVAVGTTVGEGQILLSHAGKAAAGYLEKRDFGSYTSWGDVQTDMSSNFLQLLGANVLVSAGVAVGGYGAGKVKTTTESLLTPENVAALEDHLKNTSPADILKRVEAAAYEKPFPHEEAQPQSLTFTEDGRVLRVNGDPGGAVTTDAKGNVTLNIGAAVSEVAPLSGTPLGELTVPAETVAEITKGVTPEEMTAALDTLMAPQEDAFVSADATGQDVGAQMDVKAPLTAEETSARVNQIAADTRLLTIEQRRLESQFNRKDKTGLATTATLQKLDTVLNHKEELQLERDLLEQGLMTREDVSGVSGKQRMKALASIMDRLQKSNDKIATQKQRFQAQTLASRETGKNVERRNIQSMQKKLTQYINAGTKDPAIRASLSKMVVGVATPEQFTKAGNAIRDEMVRLESKNISKAQATEQQKLIDEIETLVNRGAKVKTQSGHPTSNLDADTVAALRTLKGYLQDQLTTKPKQQGLALKAMEKFYDTQLNPDDETSPTYEELMSSGQVHLIPAKEYQDYQLAAMAHNIQNQSVLGLKVVKGNIAQMVMDSKNRVAAKQAELAAQRELENQIVEETTGAATHVRIEGNRKPSTVIKQGSEGGGASILSWPDLMEFVSYGDAEKRLMHLTDVTKAKRVLLVRKELVKGALKQRIQKALTDSGSRIDVQRYMNDASTDEYEIRYPRTDGTIGQARYTRAQIVRIHGWLKDESLRPTFKDAEKGNGWTLRGEAPVGESFSEVIESIMTPEDFVVSDELMSFYKDYGETDVNPFFREKYGADLPLKENYSPLDRDVQRVEVGAKRRQMFGSMLPGAGKTRVNSVARLVPDNAFDAADTHIDNWERFKAYDEVFGTIQNTLKRNQKVRNAIKDRHGAQTVKVIDNFIDRFIDDTPFQGDNAVAAALRGSMAKAALPWRAPVQMLQQLTAGTAMWKEHSPSEITAGMGSFLKNYSETRKAFLASPILKHRYEGGASFDLYTAIHQAGLGESVVSWITGADNMVTPEQHDALLRLGFEGIRRGDAATVQIFGGAVYHAELAKGKTPEQAIMTVERLAESTQQGDSVDQMPYVYATNPWLYTLVGQFHLQPLQLFGAASNALRALAANPTKENLMVFGKAMAVLWVLPGLFYGVVSNAPSIFMPPNANETTQNQALTAVFSEGLLGPISGLPIAGDVIEASWFAWMKPLIGVDMKHRTRISGNSVVERAEAFGDMVNAWGKLMKAEDTTKLPSIADMQKDPADDLFKAVFKTSRALGPLTGIPSQFINGPAGVANALRHDDWAGAAFAAGGWSPGAIQTRYQTEDSMALPQFGGAVEPTAVDWIRDGIIKNTPSEEEANSEDANDAILNGILYDNATSENP